MKRYMKPLSETLELHHESHLCAGSGNSTIEQQIGQDWTVTGEISDEDSHY